ASRADPTRPTAFHDGATRPPIPAANRRAVGAVQSSRRIESVADAVSDSLFFLYSGRKSLQSESVTRAVASESPSMGGLRRRRSLPLAVPIRNHSWRSATKGSTLVARRAGK